MIWMEYEEPAKVVPPFFVDGGLIDSSWSYLIPELISKADDQSKVDVWLVGIIALELLAGKEQWTTLPKEDIESFNCQRSEIRRYLQ
jgi:serine/threonine protein kinase